MNRLATAALLALLTFSVGALAADDKAGKGMPRGDKQFIDKALRDGRVEIQLGKVAQERASNPAVKQFAERLVADHTKAGDELQKIAGDLGYTPVTNANEARESRKFQKMNGEKFDRAFARQMVKDHEKSVELYRKQAQNSGTQELWQHAQKTLPTLEEHLRMARELAGEEKRGRKRKAS